MHVDRALVLVILRVCAARALYGLPPALVVVWRKLGLRARVRKIAAVLGAECYRVLVFESHLTPVLRVFIPGPTDVVSEI